MRFHIEKLLLWARSKELGRRDLAFSSGKVNIITGYSKTGKSAIIPIIDYCLGSDTCSIPVQTIRDTCSWFGILVSTEEEQWLLARREPGSQRSTGDMFVLRDPEKVEVPKWIDAGNTNVQDVKRSLDELAGLTQFDFDFEESGSGFRGRPAFRDLMAFLFQPQNVIANPEIFFYKTSSFAHREKLKSIFPYVLGAMSAEVLALTHEKNRLRSELKKKEREYRKITELSNRWIGEIRARYQTARELGLVQISVDENAQPEELVEILRTAMSRDLSAVRPSIEMLEEGVEELVRLEREEADLSTRVSELRRRLGEMRRLGESSSEYREALTVKRSRLALSDWLSNRIDEEGKCPLCGVTDHGAEEELHSFVDALRVTEVELSDFSSVPAAFDREMERVRGELSDAMDALSAVRDEREALAIRSREVREERFRTTSIARFQGNVEEAIDRFDALQSDSELVEELDGLRTRISEIEVRLEQLDPRRRLDRMLRRISAHASAIIPKLDVERPNDPIELHLGELTVVVKGPDRDDYLWEVGSGANWVAYHVAMILALQDHFIQQDHSPVPSFVVFDQPSQVYFPQLSLEAMKRWGGDEPDQPLVEPEVLAEHDEDIEAVRRIYSAIAQDTLKQNGELQAFIFDHAGKTTWGNIEGVHLVEEWREGRKLVPEHWIGHDQGLAGSGHP